MELTRTEREWAVGESRIRWSAVFAGFVVGVSVQMVLTLLGLAVGAWAINLQDAQPARGVPLGTGIWTGVSMLISAFAGGFVTSRLSGTPLRSDGIYQATVVWGVTWLVFTWLATTAMATMIGGLFSAFGSGLQTIGQAAGPAVTKAVSKSAETMKASPDMSAEGLRKQIESILQATQKSELQPSAMKQEVGQLTNKAQGGQPMSQVTDQGIAELKEKLGALDREAAVNVMVNKFGLSRTQAEELAQSSIALIEPLKGKGQEMKEQSVAMADATIHNLASAALWLFVLSMLSLLATLGGGALGIADKLNLSIEGRPVMRPAHVHG
jgi:hypothetical protein